MLPTLYALLRNRGERVPRYSLSFLFALFSLLACLLCCFLSFFLSLGKTKQKSLSRYTIYYQLVCTCMHHGWGRQGCYTNHLYFRLFLFGCFKFKGCQLTICSMPLVLGEMGHVEEVGHTSHPLLGHVKFGSFFGLGVFLVFFCCLGPIPSKRLRELGSNLRLIN